MPNKCGVFNCNGNYNDENKCRIFKLPKDDNERKKWINVIPPRADININSDKFHICERHWPESEKQNFKIMPGGHSKPTTVPSVFDVPPSCLPTPKYKPRTQTNVEDAQLRYFLEQDRIKSFKEFSPENDLQRKYRYVFFERNDLELKCLFLSESFKELLFVATISNTSTLTSPLTLTIQKSGATVPLGKLLNPNNGLNSNSQFFDCIHFAVSYEVPYQTELLNLAEKLDDCILKCKDEKVSNRLLFLKRQLQLNSYQHGGFTTADYCQALELYPRSNYLDLREHLRLPSKRKIQAIVSSGDIESILKGTFGRLDILQRQCLLLIDEVKIRPRILFSGGYLNGFAKNNPSEKATAVLGIMIRCLHGGPSLMHSIIPVHKLTSDFQYKMVLQCALQVENAAGRVVGSITDNHKVNQNYCSTFKTEWLKPWKAVHPLDPDRTWFLIYDTVHLLKCIRNNWITEDNNQLKIGSYTGNFADVRALYELERKNYLKMTPLTFSSVYPSALQRQNVTYVLNVFNERVVAALRVHKYHDTANFIDSILSWWLVVNVSRKGEDKRFNNAIRAVQSPESTILLDYIKLFTLTSSGFGKTRIQSLTHDTKKALVQTTNGQYELCKYLFSLGFSYVALREIQSDKIENEFSVYRQSTGANALMSCQDVQASYKKRLAKFSSKHLEEINISSQTPSHSCNFDHNDEELCIQLGNSSPLSSEEIHSCVYVAGWLEFKAGDDIQFADDDVLVHQKFRQFVDEVSRGKLKIPHESTFMLIQTGLQFVKSTDSHAICCTKNFRRILDLLLPIFNINIVSSSFTKCAANVILNGIHKLNTDTINPQTVVKKARLSGTS